jgi:hypothetical protein
MSHEPHVSGLAGPEPFLFHTSTFIISEDGVIAEAR